MCTPVVEIRKLFYDYLSQNAKATVGVGFFNSQTSFATTLFGANASLPFGKIPLFEIGSITKTVTATSLAYATQKGLISSLRSPVSSYLPNVKVPKTPTGVDIQFWHLATHTSGLPAIPTNLPDSWLSPLDPYANYTETDLYEFLATWNPPRSQNLSYLYSNTGFGLLGNVVARSSNMSFEDLINQTVFAPFNMRDTSTTPPTDDTHLHFVDGHDVNGAVVPHWHFKVLAGAGALLSTVDDMLSYMKAYVNPPNDYSNIIEQCLTLQFSDPTIQEQIGLGWEILTYQGRSLYWHNGGTGGFRTFLIIDPTNKSGAVVLSNYEEDDSNPIIEKLGMRVLLNIAE